MPKRFIIIFTFLLFTFEFSYAGWYTTTVDSTVNGGHFNSIALDSSGNPHICYSATGGLRHAKWTGSTWEVRVIDSASGQYSSIALDKSDNPHISHCDDVPDWFLKYTSWEGSNWNTQIVPGGSGARWSSIALDSSDYPHISYQDWTAGGLKYAKWTGSTWEVQTIDPGSNCYGTSIALDSNNNPHIGYYEHATDDLKYASWEAGTWEIQTVDSPGDVGCGVSMALEKITNYPHISYWDYTNGDLKYARWTGNPTWEIQTVDTGGIDNVGADTSIALDSNNYPHISYYDQTNCTLKYARWTGSTWEIESVEYMGLPTTSPPWRHLTSLALDSSGNPHISYFDATNVYIKYATLSPGSISCTVGGVTAGFLVTCEASLGGTVEGGAGGTGSGTYVISNLVPGIYTVECWAQGYLPQTQEANVPGGGRTVDLTFNMAAGWPMFRQDRWHTGHSPDTELSPPLKSKWSCSTEGYVYSSPSVANGKVYVGSYDNNVYALDEDTGAYIWSYYTTGGAVLSSPSVANGKVYVGSSNNNVYALDENTGAFTWSCSTENMVLSSPSVANGKVYVGSYDGKVYALDENTGTLKWSHTTGNIGYSSPSVANGRVYVGSFDNNVYALDEDTGDYIWSYTTLDDVISSPSVANGRVYVGSKDKNLYALNESNGSLIWSCSTEGYVYSPPSVANGRVYVGSNDYKVYALNENTGSVEWNYTTGNAVRSSPAAINGKLFVGSFDNKVYAFETAVPTPETITPTQEVAGKTVLATIEGYFYDGACTVTPAAKLVKNSDEISGVVTAFSTNEITCQFTIPSTAAGTWDVTVINKPNNRSGTTLEAFTIVGPPPVAPSYVPGRVLTYPTPFRPLKGDILRIGYALTDNSDIAIYIYSVGGEIVKTLRFKAGENGGRAGDNTIEWNGVTDFGYIIGNGMYVYKIISRGKVIGSGRIVVYD